MYICRSPCRVKISPPRRNRNLVTGEQNAVASPAMSCFFLCKKSDANRSYQTRDWDSGTESTNSTAATVDTDLTTTSTMSELSNQEKAEFASFSRVTACLINEKLVQSTFTESLVTISHPDS